MRGRLSALLPAVLMPLAHLGCGPSCEQQYGAGTAFKVAVPHDFSGCHVSFAAGASYTLVAGPLVVQGKGEGASCDVNSGSMRPAFTTTDYTLNYCVNDSSDGAMALSCQATSPDCSTPSELRIYYGPMPKSRGNTVSSVLSLRYGDVHPECPDIICGADIPITITW
jgi:hypothetical protein